MELSKSEMPICEGRIENKYQTRQNASIMNIANTGISMFGWLKKASQKTSLLNVSLATKTLIQICNRGFEVSNGEPSKLPSGIANEIAKAREHLYKEIEATKNVDIPLAVILDAINKASNEIDKSPLADLSISDAILNA